jgi:hypothetical protein
MGAGTTAFMPPWQHDKSGFKGGTLVHLLCFPERGARRPVYGEPGSLARHKETCVVARQSGYDPDSAQFSRPRKESNHELAAVPD